MWFRVALLLDGIVATIVIGHSFHPTVADLRHRYITDVAILDHRRGGGRLHDRKIRTGCTLGEVWWRRVRRKRTSARCSGQGPRRWRSALESGRRSVGYHGFGIPTTVGHGYGIPVHFQCLF